MFACPRQIFCDCGEEFVINDVTGEQPISVIISSVTKVCSQASVQCPVGHCWFSGQQECGDLFRRVKAQL